MCQLNARAHSGRLCEILIFRHSCMWAFLFLIEAEATSEALLQLKLG